MYYEQVCVKLDSMPIRRNQVQCVSEYASPTTGNQSYVNKLYWEDIVSKFKLMSHNIGAKWLDGVN